MSTIQLQVNQVAGLKSDVVSIDIVFTKSGQLSTTPLSMHLQREYKLFLEHTNSEADSSEELAAKAGCTHDIVKGVFVEKTVCSQRVLEHIGIADLYMWGINQSISR